MRIDDLVELITTRQRALGHPVVVGISGFAGAGKSTLARELVDAVPGAFRMRGDDFLEPSRSHRRSSDWDGVDRVRLVRDVLQPFRGGRPSTFRRYDWSARALAEPEPIPAGDVLVVDVIGLFHPEALRSIDLTIWCDTDSATARRQGTARDARSGRDHGRLWDEVWVPNDRDFERRFRPQEHAEVLFRRQPAAEAPLMSEGERE